MKKLLFFLIFFLITSFTPILRTEVIVKNNVYTISYNEVYEQPNWVIYTVRNLPRLVNRSNMNFYLMKDIHTSDNNDYVNNIYDKGHMAPAASFYYSQDALYKTFSYINCSLQNKYLNRSVWRDLENQERIWASQYDSIQVKIVLDFKENIILPTNAHVPTGYWKYIHFFNGMNKCYYFPNNIPDRPWYMYEINCN